MPDIICPEQLEYLSELKKENVTLTVEMELFAKERKVPILDAEGARFLETMIRIHKPERVLEIGTAIAYSTIRMARTLDGKGTVDTIELSRDNVKLAKNYIEKSGIGEGINLIEGDAFKIIPGLEAEYDLIFLDADKEDYMELFNMSVDKLKSGGIIFIDNLLWHGYTAFKGELPENYKESTKRIREFNKYFIEESGLKAEIFTIGDGIGVGIKE